MFKTCTLCKTSWTKRTDFLYDPHIQLIGYQADCDDLEYGLFLFNHVTPTCGTTISLQVKVFLELYDGPLYTELKAGTACCPGHCLHIDDLEPCPEKCCCACIRKLLQILVTMTNSHLAE